MTQVRPPQPPGPLPYPLPYEHDSSQTASAAGSSTIPSTIPTIPWSEPVGLEAVSLSRRALIGTSRVKYIDLVSLAPVSGQHSANADCSSAAARLASAAAQAATLRLSNEALQAAQDGLEVELTKAHQEPGTGQPQPPGPDRNQSAWNRSASGVLRYNSSVRIMYLTPLPTRSPACLRCCGWPPCGKQSAAPFGVRT